MPPLDFTDLIPDKTDDDDARNRGKNAGLPDDLTPDEQKPDLDLYDLVPKSNLTKFIQAVGRGYRQGRDQSAPFLTPQAQEGLDTAIKGGGFKAAAAGIASKVAGGISEELARGQGMMRAAQEGAQELGTQFLGPQAGRDIAALPEAFAGSPGMLHTPEAPAPRPVRMRAEPTIGEPRPPTAPVDEGPTIDDLKLRPATPTAPTPAGPPAPVDLGGVPIREAARPYQPTVEKAPSSLAEAGLPEPTVPEPAQGTETVAQPQADGTVKQVQVKTGEPPPPPSEPPAPPTTPTTPSDLRTLFPNLSDEQFEGLFAEASKQVPRDLPAGEWMAKTLEVMKGIVGPAAAAEATPEKPKRITSTQVQARDKVGHNEAVRRAEAENAAAEAAAQPQPEAALPPDLVPDQPEAPADAYGGPWSPALDEKGQPAKNPDGEPVFVNQNGVRATMDNGVPYTEPVIETENGLAPKNPDKRRPQFQTEAEAKPPEEPQPSAPEAPPKPVSMRSEPGKVPESEPEPEPAPKKAETPQLTTPTEHPGLRIKSLETGKETTIQPIGTVPPKSAAAPAGGEGVPERPGGRKAGTSAIPSVREAEEPPPEAAEPTNRVPTPQEAFRSAIEASGNRAQKDGSWSIIPKGRYFAVKHLPPGPYAVPGIYEPAAGEPGWSLQRAQNEAVERAFAEPQAAEPAPVTPENPLVTHVTKKGKTLTGTIRTDLSQDEARAIDPYAFRKDGGWFIRSKPTKSEPKAEPVTTPEQAATQAGDVPPPDPAPPVPADPAVAEAVDLAEGKGPAPVQSLPEPRKVERDRKKDELTGQDVRDAGDFLDENTEEGDRIREMLWNGWSPQDISETPGITKSPREIRAIDRFLDEDALDRSDWTEESGEPLPSWRPKERFSGLQSALRLGDEGTGPEGLQRTEPVGETGATPSGGLPEGAPDAEGSPGGQTPRPARPRVPGGRGGSRGGRDGDADPVSDTGEGSEPGATGRPDPEQVIAESKGQDFVIEPGDLGEARGRMQKARDNLKAIEVAKRVIAEKRLATVEEQRDLVKYVGWGGLKPAFRDGKGNFGQDLEKIGKRLEELLTPEELRTAARSVQYAHYTAEHVIRSMWDAVKRLGFTGGTVFEPGMGIGHFRGLMPPDIAEKSQYRGIEMDHLTADIAKLLYPNSGVAQADYTRLPLPENAFDLVIGNPPFARVPITSDPKYAAHGFELHDYFFAKSLDAVRPGGLLAFVTSAGTMNKMGAEARQFLAERGQFLGGVRLPQTAFRQNAMTDVTTDILFFKRRPEGRRDLADIPDDEKAWTETVPVTLPDDEGNPTEGLTNRYFADHPEVVLGEEGFFDKLYEGRYGIRQRPGTDLPTDLRVALSRLPEGVMDPPPTQMEAWERDFDAPETKNGSYYVAKDGTLMQYANGAGKPVQKRGKGGGGMTAADYARVVKLVPVRNALRAVFKADLADNEPAGKAARAELTKHYDAFVKEFGPINKAEISTRRPTIIQQETARREAREEARYVGDRWDEGDFDAEPYYERKAKVSEIAAARQAAREAAILAGRPFNEGSFDPDDMPDTFIDKRPNIKPFMEDPESYRLRSIESYDDTTGESTKREIFYRNPISKYTEPELKSVNDGLLWSLNSLGRFDVEAIAEKMGKTEDTVITELGDLVFEPPETPGVWVTRDDYLSGDVKTKLAQAQDAARKNSRYQRNVDALETAQPVPLSPGQITMVVGMPWIPMDVIREFARDGLELGNPVIQYSPAISRWSVEPSTNRWNTDTAVGLPKWSTPRATAYELLQDALNRVQPAIYDRVRDGPDILNENETQAARDKVAAIQRYFFDPDLRSGWATAEPTRAKTVADAYNDALNREVLRQFNGDYLTTPGIAGSWRWRPHQTRVISRIILQGNTYMAHAVGAGKTSAMIGAGMEMKRLNLVKKPMYVVPNHMLGQFTKEFYEQYPAARIAVADDEQFHTDRRRQFMANVAADDLDAVIITHSSFKKIPVSDEFMRQSIQEEIDELTEGIRQAEGDRFTVRRLEAMKERLEQKLSKPMTDKDQTLNFEDMGVDFLFVDEAHGYRKLPFVTLQGNVKGIDPNGSDAARDLHMKVRYLEKQRPGRSIVLASGTPVTNTMGELYSISRYLQPNAMAERGVSTFDAWAQTFANTKSVLEQNPDGTYKEQTRLSLFVNMPELYKMVGSVMDIVTSEQLGQYVTRPKLKNGERIFNQVDPTPEQVAYTAELGRRMEAIKNRSGPPEKGDDIILNVINDGRHAAIDPRFISEAQGNTKSKLNKMLDNVVKIWKDSADTQFYDPASKYEKPSFKGPATQMIFANLGLNPKNGFSTYDWIKEYLRRAGVPASEVAFIRDYKTSIAKQGLFNDMNEGKVRILIGSTQKMGTGVNAQRRLLAVHNLDPLWFPADDEQRNGRILRQGNHNPEIQIHDYATNGSYDSTMWQMMGRKAGFIEQFFRGDPNLRDMEDLGEASMYEQAAAMTTSDPRVMQLTQLRMDLRRLILRREGFRSNQWTLENKLDLHNRGAVWYDKRQAAAEQDIAQRQDISGKKFTAIVDGETYTDRAEFNKAVDAVIEKHSTTWQKEGDTKDVGMIGGFPIRLYRGRTLARPEIVFNMDRDKQLEGNYALSAQAHLRNLETDRENYEANAAKERSAAAAIKPLLGEKFTEDDEIARLDKAVKDLEAELKGPTDAEKNAMAAEDAPTTLVNQVGGGLDLDQPREVKPPTLTGRVVDLPDDLEPD